MRTKFSEIGIGVIFLLIGIVAILGGISLTKSMVNFRETAIQTKAKVDYVNERMDSDGDLTYSVEYKYSVNGKMYEGGYTTSRYTAIGDTITVYYDENNPSKSEQTISISGGIVLCGIGGVFAVIGIIIFVAKINGAKTKKRLLENGEKIYADLQEVILNTSYRVNNRSPYVIVCKATDNITGEVRTFKSVNIWDNPQIILAQKNIKTFPVYIDRNNSNKYYVSLEEIGLD